MLQRTGEAETITTHYLAALGAYRALYIPNWIYRYVFVYFNFAGLLRWCRVAMTSSTFMAAVSFWLIYVFEFHTYALHLY